MNVVPSHFMPRFVSVPVAAGALAACVVLAGYGRAVAQNNNGVQSMIPAFYQHQGANDAGGPTSITPSMNPIWMPDQGWCAYVSYMDALYPWETLTSGGMKPYDNNNVWLFGTPGAPGTNPGTGLTLTSNGTWLATADNTVIPQLVAAMPGFGPPGLNSYLDGQKVSVGSPGGPGVPAVPGLGLAGLVDTQYRIDPLTGQVQAWSIAGWKNITPNTFQLYQQLTGTGATLPANLQPFAAITTTLRLGYVGAANQANTGFWWSFHQVAGAGVAGANTIRYSDPDAIPANAGNRNGGFTQAAVNANQYSAAQAGGAVPLPTNTNPATGAAYGANNLYSTMQVNALGQIIGGNGPYATGLMGGMAPVARINDIDAVSLSGVQLLNNVLGPLFNTATFLFSGNFGGDISKLEVFANSPLNSTDLGLSQTAPNWGISQVSQDPFGNSWASTNGGILLSAGMDGADLIEQGQSYKFTENTTGLVTGWTLFAYDQADGYWLTESYGAGDAYGAGPQVPEPAAWLLLAIGFLGPVSLALLRRSRQLKTFGQPS
jgi:hypothetical protein